MNIRCDIYSLKLKISLIIFILSIDKAINWVYCISTTSTESTEEEHICWNYQIFQKHIEQGKV